MIAKTNSKEQPLRLTLCHLTATIYRKEIGRTTSGTWI